MYSLTVTGLGIELFIGLVNELTKVAWLTVEAGRVRGRQFRFDRRGAARPSRSGENRRDVRPLERCAQASGAPARTGRVLQSVRNLPPFAAKTRRTCQEFLAGAADG